MVYKVSWVFYLCIFFFIVVIMLGVLCAFWICNTYMNVDIKSFLQCEQTLFYIGKNIIEADLGGKLLKTNSETGRLLYPLLGS